MVRCGHSLAQPTMRPVRLVALIRPDQRQWLQRQASPLRSVADVIRDLIDEAMARGAA